MKRGKIGACSEELWKLQTKYTIESRNINYLDIAIQRRIKQIAKVLFNGIKIMTSNLCQTNSYKPFLQSSICPYDH